MTLAACLVVFALTSGGLIHSIVPHHHSHDENGATSEIWAGMHQALHSTKKFAFDVSNTFPLLLMFVFADALTQLFLVNRRLFRSFALSEHDPTAGRLLRRGILRYRAFG